MEFDRNQLKAEIYRSGYKLNDIGEWLGITREAVTSKQKGKARWSREDIVKIAEHIGRDKILDIFFAE